jgi:hypothetical protein
MRLLIEESGDAEKFGVAHWPRFSLELEKPL